MTAPLRLLTKLAQATSDANAVYRETVCNQSAQRWELLTNEQQRDALMAIQRTLEKRPDTAEAAHEAWVEDRVKGGWQLAPDEDRAEKKTPYLVPWSELDPIGQAKSTLFLAIVKPFYGMF